VANNNYPQITSVTSEALQSQLRTLLPSQEGFGTDLMAQNVIVPIIDLTSAAEGSSVGQNLQTAIAFGSQTPFEAANSTSLVANNPGFWRVIGTASNGTDASGPNQVRLAMDDGLSTKNVWQLVWGGTSTVYSGAVGFDLTFFLEAGITLNAISNDGSCFISGSARQIADVNGVLVNPSGFTPQ